MKVRTRGVSPKVAADLLVTAVAFLLTGGVIELDPTTAAIVSKALGTLAAVVAGPGRVEER